MLTVITLRKLFAECFPPEVAQQEGIILIWEDDRQTWFEKLKAELEKRERVTCFISRRSNSQPSTVYLGLQLAGGSGGHDDYFNLTFETRDDRFGLWILDKSRRKIKTDRPAAAVSNVGQIVKFVDLVHARQNRNALRNTRQQKLASFKKTGLTSQLRDLGKEHGFAFAIGENKRDVHLSIRLPGRKTGFHFTFPKGKLDALLGDLPEFLATLERMQKLSITFSKNDKRWAAKVGEWIEPDAGR